MSGHRSTPAGERPRPRRALLGLAAAVALLPAATLPLPAQEPSLFTADPFPVGAGRVLVSAGVEHVVKDADPGVAGGAGDAGPVPPRLRRLTRIPTFLARAGAAENVDVIAGWSGRLFAADAGGASHADWGDPFLAASIAVAGAGGPSVVAVLFGVKLPSTRYLPAGLGNDATDAFFLGSWGGRFDRFEARVAAGAAIVGDPRNTGSQDDLLAGSASGVWRASDGVSLLAELFGFTGPREGDDKLRLRAGVSVAPGGGPPNPGWSVTLHGLGRIAGDRRDFATAFLGTADWGFGATVTVAVGD